jgi:hypothetical protein
MLPTPVLRTLLVATAWASSSVLAQEADLERSDDRRLTVMAGLGNTFAGVGGTVEYWFPHQASVVAGLGTGLDTGVEAALGLRLFTGQRHRLFLEAVYAPIAVSIGPGSERARYGPGMTVGYGYTSDGGFSALFGLGAGVATAVRAVELMANLGFGYTWRR